MQVLETGGVVAVIQVMVLLGGGIFIRWFWAENQRLHAKIEATLEDHAGRMALNQSAHADHVAKLQTQYNALQERRVAEAQRVTEQVVQHVTNVDRTMEKLEASLDVLIELSSKR
jgi:hypothetical protein